MTTMTLVLGTLAAAAGVLLGTSTAAGDDWPMYNHDSRRTCATADQVDPPYRVLWIRDFYATNEQLMVQGSSRPAPYDDGPKLSEQIASGVQAIVADGVLYIGTLSNRLYALEAATGRTKWRIRLGDEDAPGAILHSPAVADGRVFVASLDGHVYALDADSGDVLWRFRGGRGGFWNSPLPLGGRIYVGGRDGNLHALSASSGELVWTLQTDGPILNSPSTDGKRIYVASEDHRIYCVQADSGQVVWKSNPLPGRSARWYCPVIDTANGVCYLTTSPPEIADWLYGAGDTLANLHADGTPLTVSQRGNRAWKSPPDLDAPYDAERAAAEQEAIIAFLRTHPEHQTTHVLNLADGRESRPLPILFRAGCGGVPTPPVVAPDGRVYVLNRSYYSNFDLDSYCVFGGIGRLAGAGGRIDLLNQAPGSPRPLWGNGIDLICDESAALTVGGGRLYVSHGDNTGTMELTSRRTHNIYGLRDQPGGLNPRELPYSGTVSRNFDLMQASITEWHGPGRGALTVVGDKLFWVTCGIVVAIEGTPAEEAPSAQPTRDEQPAAAESEPTARSDRRPAAPKLTMPSDEMLTKILWQALQPGAPTGAQADALRAELERTVAEFLDGAPWAPFEGVFGRGQAQGYFADVSETFHALSLAYPYLGCELQTKVKAFLDAEQARRDPLTANYEPGKGRRREHFVVGPKLAAQVRHERTSPENRLYRLWAYHYYTGTPVDAETWARYSRHATRAGQGREAGVFWYASENVRLGSLIGAARLAAMAGDEKATTILGEQARQAMRDRLGFEQEHRPVDNELNSWHPLHDRGGDFVVRTGNSNTWIPRWRGLTPEIGRLLKTGAADDMARQDHYIDTTRPVGFMAWGPKQFEGEVDGNQPHQAMSLFQAKAYIQQRSGAELTYYADIPWCRADLYHIEKLAAAMRAYSALDWTDVRTVE